MWSVPLVSADKYTAGKGENQYVYLYSILAGQKYPEHLCLPGSPPTVFPYFLNYLTQ